MSNLRCQCPLSPPKASLFTTVVVIPSLGGKTVAVGQKHRSSWWTRERTGSNLVKRHSGISSTRCKSSLLSLNRITFLLPKINIGAFPHCQGEGFEFSTKGSRHPLGHLLTCLLMGAVPWASTGSNLVVVSACAHLFFELSSHPFFLADPF